MKSENRIKSISNSYIIVLEPSPDIWAYSENDGKFRIFALSDAEKTDKRKDLYSETAVKACVEFCRQELKENMSSSEIMDIMREAFIKSQAQISEMAKNDNLQKRNYDITISLTVHRSGQLWHGTDVINISETSSDGALETDDSYNSLSSKANKRLADEWLYS